MVSINRPQDGRKIKPTRRQFLKELPLPSSLQKP
jgi:hypothetical protein